MSALYLTRDLLFSSRVTSAAADCGLAMAVVSDVEALTQRVRAGGVRFVLIDFSTPGIDLLDLVRQLHQSSPEPLPIVAYGPHVDVAGMAGARQAGCTAVFTRGQFNNQMAHILRQFGCAT